MFQRLTVLDLLLPRILTGEAIGRENLALLGHCGVVPQLQAMPVSDLQLRQGGTGKHDHLPSFLTELFASSLFDE